MNPWGKLSDADNAKWEELGDKYMPAMGKADTVGGEIIRAMNRIVYRYYNDGDTVSYYYGSSNNILFNANKYIEERVPDYVSLDDANRYGPKYEEKLCKNLKLVLDYLLANPKVFEMPNENDFTKNAPLCRDNYDWDDDE